MKTITILLLSFLAAASAQSPTADDFQVSGMVVDHLTNRPLNHVLVELVKIGKGGGDASALTEADGRFKFLHVPKGKYQLLAEKRGQMPQGFHADGPYSTAIVVDGKQDTNNILFALNTDAMLNGMVQGDDGDPVRGAQVILFREGVTDGEPQTRQVRSTSTNSSGQFHLGHLEAGKYYVSVQASPWFAQQISAGQSVYPVTFYGDATNAAAAQPVILPEGGSANLQINLHLVPGIHVKLAEQTQGVNISVQGPGGTRIPITAATSYIGTPPPPSLPTNLAGRLGTRAFSSPNMVGVRNADAQMELTNLAAGQYQVGFATGRGAPSGTPRTVDLTDGSILTVEPPASSSITGSVIFEGPRPTQDVELYLSGGQRGLMAEVAADGTFKFDKAISGTYAVHLNMPGLIVSSVTAKGARMLHDNLEISAGAAVELTVRVITRERLTHIEGVALRDGAGMPGAMVLLLPHDFDHRRLFRRDQSDGDGSFNLADIQPGRYTLIAIDDGNDLAYKDEAVIKPYLAGGVPLTIPLTTTDPIKATVRHARPSNGMSSSEIFIGPKSSSGAAAAGAPPVRGRFPAAALRGPAGAPSPSPSPRPPSRIMSSAITSVA